MSLEGPSGLNRSASSTSLDSGVHSMGSDWEVGKAFGSRTVTKLHLDEVKSIFSDLESRAGLVAGKNKPIVYRQFTISDIQSKLTKDKKVDNDFDRLQGDYKLKKAYGDQTKYHSKAYNQAAHEYKAELGKFESLWNQVEEIAREADEGLDGLRDLESRMVAWDSKHGKACNQSRKDRMTGERQNWKLELNEILTTNRQKLDAQRSKVEAAKGKLDSAAANFKKASEADKKRELENIQKIYGEGSEGIEISVEARVKQLEAGENRNKDRVNELQRQIEDDVVASKPDSKEAKDILKRRKKKETEKIKQEEQDLTKQLREIFDGMSIKQIKAMAKGFKVMGGGLQKIGEGAMLISPPEMKEKVLKSAPNVIKVGSDLEVSCDAILAGLRKKRREKGISEKEPITKEEAKEVKKDLDKMLKDLDFKRDELKQRKDVTKEPWRDIEFEKKEARAHQRDFSSDFERARQLIEKKYQLVDGELKGAVPSSDYQKVLELFKEAESIPLAPVRKSDGTVTGTTKPRPAPTAPQTRTQESGYFSKPDDLPPPLPTRPPVGYPRMTKGSGSQPRPDESLAMTSQQQKANTNETTQEYATIRRGGRKLQSKLRSFGQGSSAISGEEKSEPSMTSMEGYQTNLADQSLLDDSGIEPDFVVKKAKSSKKKNWLSNFNPFGKKSSKKKGEKNLWISHPDEKK